MAVSSSSIGSAASVRVSGSLSPQISSKNPALETLMRRIESVIRDLKLEFPPVNENLDRIICPVTRVIPNNPVVAKCGHIYEGEALQQMVKTINTCALCRGKVEPISELPVAFKNLISEWRKEDPIPTFANFKTSNQARAATYIEIAEGLIAKNDYTEALEMYSKASQFTNSSVDYAAIPELYDKLEEPEKATLSRLHLCLYLIREGKFQEAIQTLEGCEQFDPLLVGLTLQANSSSGNILWAFDRASNQGNAEDRIFIYKQIIAHDPNKLEAYEQLITLIKDPKEKRQLLAKAADIAHAVRRSDLEVKFRQELKASILSTVISKNDWANARAMSLPEYPQELKDFLAGDCTIWPGKKRSETHIVVPLFPQVHIYDSPVPCTLTSLDNLDKASGGPGFRFIWFNISRDRPAEQEFHYGVITKDLIPESCGKTYDEQIGLLPAGYEAPGVLDVGRALLWENRRSSNQYLNDDKTFTLTCCREEFEGLRTVAGSFTREGLMLHGAFGPYIAFTGIAGWRKF